MAKKLKSWQALFCTLAVLTTIAFIAACGGGPVIDVGMGESMVEIDDAQLYLGPKVQNILSEQRLSSESEEESSSSEEEEGESSSSEEASSSSSNNASQSPSSSSSEAKSSSSPYILACEVIKNNLPAEYIPPHKIDEYIKITCKKNNDPSSITISGEFATFTPNFWPAPESGRTYENFQIKITDDLEFVGPECARKEATCTGSLRVSGTATPSSSSRPSTTSSSSTTGGGGTSSSSNPPSSSSASTPSSASTVAGPCKENNVEVYCKWGNDCSAIDSRYGYMGETEATQTCGPKTSPCACSDLISSCKSYSDSKTVYTNSNCTTSGGGTSSPSGTSSSSGSGGGGTGSITLSLSTSNSTFSAGTYTVTANAVNKCSINCDGNNVSCSLSGAITASGNNYLGNMSVASGSVTITGTVKFNNCWKE